MCDGTSDSAGFIPESRCAISMARGPEMRTIPTLPSPGGVAIAAIVSSIVLSRRFEECGSPHQVATAASATGEGFIMNRWRIIMTLLVNQYSTSPEGKEKNTKVITNGIIKVIAF